MRRSASEVLRSLEVRIARLEKQSDAGTMSVQDLVKNLQKDGIHLPPNNPNLKYRDQMKQTKAVGRLLGDRMAGWLYSGKSIKLKGLSVAVGNPKVLGGVPSFVTPSGDFLFLDGYFQERFEEGFKNSDYIEGEWASYSELRANVDSEEMFEDLKNYEVKVPKLDFKWSNGTLTINPKR
jgi:hypothetical protein